jgi:prolyl 4-hydroxylase
MTLLQQHPNGNNNKNSGHKIPVANCDISKGELITLYPIQYCSMGKQSTNDNHKDDDDDDDSAMPKNSDTMICKSVNLLQKERYPYPQFRRNDRCDDDDDDDASSSSQPVKDEPLLYIYAKQRSVYSEGWYGNLIPTVLSSSSSSSSSSTTDITSNCMFVPLPSVAPICGIVATRPIAKGDELIAGTSFEDETNTGDENDTVHPSQVSLYQWTDPLTKQYAHELADLRTYLQMAYNIRRRNHNHMPTDQPNTAKHEIVNKYHSINQKYPHLTKIHSNPDIYTVDNFLTVQECDRIIRKAKFNIRPCLVKNEQTGAVEQDPSRTSTNANIPRREIPTVIGKLLELLRGCDGCNNCHCVREEQMEIIQVLNYQKGQEFQPHTDGFDGPTTACGFQDSGRIATVFCYLNDVATGGTTVFTKIGLEIRPKRGMAVIHFPMSQDLVEDGMTEHQGSVAFDEKWILTAWIWKHWRADYRYSEENLESLSEDVI